MVRFWDEVLIESIKTTKRRIIFCEKHGIGDSCIKEKARLKHQERMLEERKHVST